LKVAAAATALGLALVCAPPALAGTAVAGDSAIRYTARGGERNELTVRERREGMLVRDSAGVTAGAGCESVDSTSALCDVRHAIVVRLGDRDDRLNAPPRSTMVSASGGGGRDVLIGGRESDRLSGGPGGDRLRPGPGLDFVRAGGGRDSIRARDRSPDRIDCGRGLDRVRVDKLDWMNAACERVSRRSAAAVPLDNRPRLTTGDFSPQFLQLLVACPADGPSTCVGAASIVRRDRRLARTEFRIRRGHKRNLDMEQSRLREDLEVRIVVRSRDQRGLPVTRAIRALILPGPSPPGGEGGGGGTG
jgi:hypothetical protein